MIDVQSTPARRTCPYKLQAMIDSAFIYEPLKGASKQLRLVTIHPSTDELVRCSLQTVALDSLPSSDALSYSRGDPYSGLFMLLNGRRVQVTTNLESALQHLGRMKDLQPGLVLWIDAICNDQRNDLEKSILVRSISKTYQEARKVLLVRVAKTVT